MSDWNKDVGEVLSKCRTDKKLTRREVAVTVGVTENSIYRWERGLSAPSPRPLLDLMALYGLKPGDLP